MEKTLAVRLTAFFLYSIMVLHGEILLCKTRLCGVFGFVVRIGFWCALPWRLSDGWIILNEPSPDKQNNTMWAGTGEWRVSPGNRVHSCVTYANITSERKK